MFFPNNLHEGFILRSTIYKYFCSTSPEANTNGGDHLCFQEADGLVTFSFSFTHSRGSSPHFGGPCKSCPSSCDFSPEALRSAAFATGQYPPPWVFWQHGKLIRTIEINSLPPKHILFPLSLVSNALLFSSHSGFHLWGSKQSPYIADFISLGKHLHPFVLAFCPWSRLLWTLQVLIVAGCMHPCEKGMDQRGTLALWEGVGTILFSFTANHFISLHLALGCLAYLSLFTPQPG